MGRSFFQVLNEGKYFLQHRRDFYVESNRGGFVIMEIKDDQSTDDIQDTPNAFA